MRILIFNPDEKGHNFIFLKLLIPALNTLGCNITLALTESGFTSEEFHTHLAPLYHFFQLDTQIMQGTGGRRQQIAQLAAAVKRNQPEHLLVPNAEPLLALLGLQSALGRMIIPTGITQEFTLIRADFAYPAANLKQRAWFWAKERSINAMPNATISVIDPIAYENIRHRGSSLAERICLLPEPLDNAVSIGKTEARRRLGLPVHGRYLICTGVLDHRKGINLILSAFAKADLNPGDRLLLAGKAGPDIEEMLSGAFAHLVRDDKIILLNRYLSDNELNSVICAADVVAATYRTTHCAPSGIINKAAVTGRPVLASRFGWSDIIVPEFGLGTLTDINNPEVLAQDIAVALDQSAYFTPSPKVSRLQEYLSPANFINAWTAGISRLLGKSAPEIKSWEWVRYGVITKSESMERSKL